MSNRDTTRYNPRGLTPLNEAMGQLFRDAFTASGGGALVPATGLGLNLYETDEGYLLQALLPGVNPDALTITAQENVLTLQGTTRIAAPEHAR
ncbi:MAG: Hsp20/alpha crystallin family protein, partial [Chloroflexi bacterium]|nr:Hsp20/alpha crystallin family protein [Chloroflexota bacterium]